ncbi:hypothetical protein HZA40_04180 [Candidatus Peregrinibacteria bacterium]|nr:hypothetical protein [Candidatus Peregrinibacteria bacterium]
MSLASRYHSTVVRSADEINGCGGSLKGLASGLVQDAMAAPELLRSFMAMQFSDLMSFELGGITFGTSTGLQPTRELIIIPGFAASARHLSTLMRHIGKRAVPHPQLAERKITATVLNDATILAEDIGKKERETDLCGHSRGGLVVLCALQMLQNMGCDGLISQAFLLSPTSTGVRPEIALWAKHLGIDSVQDLCPDSKATQFWQSLTPKNRAKISIISQNGGDGFTAPETSFVPGATMFVTPPCGHQESVRDPTTDYFKLVRDLVKHPIIITN